MILHCNYEEIQALRFGAGVLVRDGEIGGGSVAAPPADPETLHWMATRMRGDMQLDTLAEARAMRAVVSAVVDALRAAMAEAIVASHPAAEVAVASYFDYAHSLSVLGRVRNIESEMEAMIEVVTGGAVTSELAESFEFPE